MSNKILLFLFIAFTFSIEIDKTSLLFCLNKNEPLLELDADGFLKRGNFSELNNILDLFSDSYFIEPWLSAATADDYSGDIYLNRIYRISFNNTFPD